MSAQRIRRTPATYRQLRASLPTDTHEGVSALFARADNLAERFLEAEMLGRQKIVSAFEVDVPKAIGTLEQIIAELFGTSYKDDFVRGLLRSKIEGISEEIKRQEAGEFIARMSQTELQGSVAGSVVSITENYLNLLSLGRTPAEALTDIDDFRSRMNGGQIRNRNSLLDYVRDRIRLDHKGYNLSELYLE